MSCFCTLYLAALSQYFQLNSWEDDAKNGTRRMPQAGVSGSASNPSQRGGRGRGGQSRGHNTGMTFVSATGDPISGRRCYVCGEPSHFANACPNRGS
ncbi:hypothetical protein WN943_023262 [Citrus x changshan-huyou]